MSVEKKILKQKFGWTFLGNTKIKIKLLCSCGKKYSVRHKMSEYEESDIFTGICPSCKEESYIGCNVKNYGFMISGSLTLS